MKPINYRYTPPPPPDLAAGGLTGGILGGVAATCTATAIYLTEAAWRGWSTAGDPMASIVLDAFRAAADLPIIHHADAVLPLLTHAGWAGLITGAVVGWLTGSAAASQGEGVRPVRGRRVTTRPGKNPLKGDIKLSGEGIKIHPDIPISIDRETRGILVFGSVGAGKTVIINQLVSEIIKRGDQAIIYDNKMDNTEGLHGMHGVVTVTPWDKRSVAWDIAADTDTRIDAAGLASRLIPEGSSDPIWHESARIIFMAVIENLQKTRGTEWGWKDIIDSVAVPYEKLREIAIAGNEISVGLMPEKHDKTVGSFISQITSALLQVSFMADAWGGVPKDRRFSMRRFAGGIEGGARVLLMGGSKRYEALTKAYIQGLIQTLQATISEMRDSKTRRIWIVLDEFAQLGKMPEIIQILEVGRSKGVRLILGTQDINQVEKIYDAPTAKALTSMAGTTIITRTQGVETPRYLSDLIGERTVSRYTPTHSGQMGATGQIGAGSRTDVWVETVEPVVSPDELGLLGPVATGCRALLIPGGKEVYDLIWPYLDLPGKGKGEPLILADWTQPGWPASADRMGAAMLGGEHPSDPAMETTKGPREPSGGAQIEEVTVWETPRQAEAGTSEPTTDDGETKEALTEALPEPMSTAVAAIELLDEITPAAGAPGEIHVSTAKKRYRRRAEADDRSQHI